MKFLTIIAYTVYETVKRFTLLFYLIVATIILLTFVFTVKGLFVDGELTAVSFLGNQLPVVPELDPSKLLIFSTIGGSILAMTLLGMFATAGIIPSTLRRGTIDIYLSKPVSRLFLLSAKYSGAVAALSVGIVYFMGGLYLIIGLKLGIWNPDILIAAGLTILMFSSLYGFVVFIAVISRSTAIVILFVYIHSLIASGLLESREEILFGIITSEPIRHVIHALYYILPQTSGMNSAMMNLFSPAVTQTPMDFTFTPYIYSIASGFGFFVLSYLVMRRSDY
jgi:ABC-type transport system involved in multi-copper enzyme maturation permease subunit